MKKPVYCIELKKSFESIAAAAREMNIEPQWISFCCRGWCKTAAGYHWVYESNLIP